MVAEDFCFFSVNDLSSVHTDVHQSSYSAIYCSHILYKKNV